MKKNKCKGDTETRSEQRRHVSLYVVGLATSCHDVVCLQLVPVVLLGAPVVYRLANQRVDVCLRLREQQAGAHALRHTSLAPAVKQLHHGRDFVRVLLQRAEPLGAVVMVGWLGG